MSCIRVKYLAKFAMLNCVLILCIIVGIHANHQTSKNVQKSSVIVNPLYDPKDDNDMNDRSNSDPMLPPTQLQLIETHQLRNIINNAVQSGTYAVSDSDKSMMNPQISILSWLNSILSSTASNVSETKSGSEKVGLIKEVSGNTNQLSPLQSNTNSYSTDIKSNLIESAVVSGLDKKPLIFAPKRVQREQLQIMSIEEDLSFPHGQNIQSWITIQGRTRTKHALVGITNNALVLIVNESGSYKIVDELYLHAPILCFTNYMQWNHTSRSIHGVIIVGIENELIFISTTADFNGLAITWKWKINSVLESLAYFSSEDSKMILMVNAPSSRDEISADIYKFDLDTKHTWLIQKIPLKEPCKSVQVLHTYKELVLCFVQNNTVELYTTVGYPSSEIFQFDLTIDASNVQSVSGFEMGDYTYLAITGLEPKIYRYHRGRFIPQTILSRNWGLVEFIVPIPARTYRDDLILLVQHRILMGTHSVSIVEALIWDGEAFDISLSIPCRIGDQIIDFGLSCLLDYDRESGIKGLSTIQTGNSISLIIPRFDAPSSMFRMWFELKSFDSGDAVELKDFEVESKEVEMVMNYQNEIISRGKDALERGNVVTNNGNINDVSAMWNLNTVTSDNLILNHDSLAGIGEIYIGNEKWTEDELNLLSELMFTIQELEETVNQLEKEVNNNDLEITSVDPPGTYNNIGTFPVNGKFDIRSLRVEHEGKRPKRSETPQSQIYVNKLTTKNVNVEYINGVPIDNLVFTEDGVLNSVDSLVIENDLKVLNKVQILFEPNESVGTNIENEHLKDGTITAKGIHINGNVNIESINGVIWIDFVKQIVMKNLPNIFDQLTVKGDIVAKEDILVDYLNEIPFPNEYFWMHGSDLSIIAGNKVFKGKLICDSIDTETIDGINTQETIGLSDEQYIRGLTTFAQLEVTESLQVNGTINGKHLNEFKPNRSLLETTQIPSDCLFQHLEVHGPIYITNYCNGVIIDEILGDVVYKSNPKTTIMSFKTFQSIKSVVELTSNLINNIPVNNYMTADTNQDLSFDRLIGNVMIGELTIGDLFDFINVTELDQNSIKLMGEQFTEAEIIFNGGNDELNIDAESLEIRGSLNGLTINDLIRIDKSLEINGNLVINTALANDLIVGGEVNGKGVINGIILEEFDKIRLSRTLPQEITSEYYIENAFIENDIDSAFVNGVYIEDLKKHIDHVKNLPDFVTSTGVKLNSLVVDGNLVVNIVNGHDFNSVKENAIPLNKPNIISGNLEFLDKFVVEKGVVANNVNNEPFENFIASAVLKTDDNIEFSGRKVFQQEFHIENDLNVNSINGIAAQNIWKKSSSREITGHVNIFGNLFVENLNVQGQLNSVYVRNIQNKYNFDGQRQAHVLTNNIQFNSPITIQDLRIQNGLNGVANVSEFLSNIIRKNHVGIITGKKRFQSNVIFKNDLKVIAFDTVNVENFFNNIIINEINENVIIVGDVIFEGDVEAPFIHASGDILTNTVMGCSLAEWNENGLRTNAPVKIFKSLVFPVGTLQTADIALQFLNDYSMDTIITLNTDQHFHGHSLFSEVVSFNSIDVNGLVNGYNIRDLLENSVMVTGDNHIKALTTFQSARVLEILQTIGTVNGIDFNNIATLHEDLYLYGPFSFRSISARSLNTKDQISGIDFDYWYTNSLWKSQRETQVITGTWIITNGIFHSSVNGQSLINGIPIKNIAEKIGAHHTNVIDTVEVFTNDFNENCRKMESLIKKTRTLSYFLSHFEESFSIYEQNIINSVHFFEAYGNNYLVMNIGCLTVVYVWNKLMGSYERICEAQTGNANSWIDVLDEWNVIHLVSNTEEDRSNCPTSGLNVWKFDGSTLVHASKMEETNKFSDLHNIKNHPTRFLALTKDKDRVNEFDLQHNLVEEWHLPIADQEFRFLPENANLGLALSNGKQLSVLSSTSTAIRNQRSTNPFAEASGDKIDVDRPFRCSLISQKLHDLSARCKLLQQAKLKAFSNIGPFRNLEPSVGNRLLKDFERTNKKQKLVPQKNIPLERGPQSSSNFMSMEKNIFTARSDGQTVNNSTARDAFGTIEAVVTDLTDNAINGLIDIDTDEEEIDFDDNLIGSRNQEASKGANKLNSTVNGIVGLTKTLKSLETVEDKIPQVSYNRSVDTSSAIVGTSQLPKNSEFASTSTKTSMEKQTTNSTTRDAFGVFEGTITDLTDNVVNNLIEIDTDEEDIDFDDNLIGLRNQEASKGANKLNSTVNGIVGLTKTLKSLETVEDKISQVSYNRSIDPSSAIIGTSQLPKNSEFATTSTKTTMEKPTANSTARDAFGVFEGTITDLADNVVNNLIEIDTDEEDIDFDDNLIGLRNQEASKESNKLNSTVIGNVGLTKTLKSLETVEDKIPQVSYNRSIDTSSAIVGTSQLHKNSEFAATSTKTSMEKPIANSTARDAFGVFEGTITDLADNVVNNLIEIDTDEEDIDFDDNLIGSRNQEAPKGATEKLNSPENMIVGLGKTVKLVETIKDTYKENQEKLKQMFPQVNDDELGLNNGEKSENSHLPKIPQVNYNSSTDTSSDITEATQLPQDNLTELATTPTETSTEEPTTDSIINGEEVGDEQTISKHITSEGIATAENVNFPSHPAEEIVSIIVGETKRHLIGVSSLKEHTIQGKHDLIRIYEDIVEGKLFQTLICQRPRSLSVLNIRDESILAFIENDVEVQIYVYRGIQGFVKFTSLELPSYVFRLTSIHLPSGDPFACSKPFLAARMKKEIRFIEAKTCGYCGNNAELRCD